MYVPCLPLNRVQVRAKLTEQLLKAVRGLIIPHVRAADESSSSKSDPSSSGSSSARRTTLVDSQSPAELKQLLNLDLPENGVGKDGLLELVERTLKYSVNTWDQGFMDKLYASTTPTGVISELVLAILNTNVRPPSPLRHPCPLWTPTRL